MRKGLETFRKRRFKNRLVLMESIVCIFALLYYSSVYSIGGIKCIITNNFKLFSFYLLKIQRHIK